MNIEDIARKIAKSINEIRPLCEDDDNVIYFTNTISSAIVVSAAMLIATVDECLREIRNEVRRIAPSGDGS